MLKGSLCGQDGIQDKIAHAVFEHVLFGNVCWMVFFFCIIFEHLSMAQHIVSPSITLHSTAHQMWFFPGRHILTSFILIDVAFRTQLTVLPQLYKFYVILLRIHWKANRWVMVIMMTRKMIKVKRKVKENLTYFNPGGNCVTTCSYRQTCIVRTAFCRHHNHRGRKEWICEVNFLWIKSTLF